MVLHICPDCNREFTKKSHYDYHIENKKKPCNPTINILPHKSSQIPHKSSQILTIPSQIEEKYELKEDIIDLILKKKIHNDENNDNNNNKITCMYCDKFFTRIDNLQRHQSQYCKSKVNHDELEKLKEKMNIMMANYENLEKNYQDLVKNNQGNEINNGIVNTNTNNNNNNKINNGVINNINIVQFGQEDISKLNLPEAMKQYLLSTGGNIASNMLKYINLNAKYPENHNICITDISRELVKIHNGTKFVTKKFKNVKNDIMKNVVKNTMKIMDNYEKDKTIKKTMDIKTKMKINEVSLKLIDGISGEDIVREEIKEKEKLLKYKDDMKKDMINKGEQENSESEEERDFTFEERLRIEHLDKKREGLQIKTFENIKEELYNAKEII